MNAVVVEKMGGKVNTNEIALANHVMSVMLMYIKAVFTLLAPSYVLGCTEYRRAKD